MPTLGDLKDRVKAELDLEDEDFISEAEMNGYCRRAINSAENIILNLYEDYYLARPHTITLVSGTSEYSLPTGIYAQKIRKLIYSNGSDRYLVKKIKRLEDTATLETGDDYMYLLTNDSTDGISLTVYPEPSSNGETLTLWYLRNANEVTDDDDEIDLPEAYDYLTQYVKDACVNKERATPDAPKSAALQEEERLLTEALSERVPDDDNVLQADLSFYYEVN
jgi:hypothetical protein